MSRAEALRAAYEAELAVVELEDHLAAAKAEVPRCERCGRRQPAEAGELGELKQQLREARQAFRTARAGEATAKPDVVQVAAAVSSAEGGA